MNSVIVSIGFITIKWYSVLVLIGFTLGYFLVINKFKKENFSLTSITDMCFYLIIYSILGARIYYCLFEFNYYKYNLLEVFKLWEGGLAIHGGIISGAIFLYFYTKKRGINFLQILDIYAPALVLGQAIGRWGNFFNQEAYGPMVSLARLKQLHIPNFIIEGMYINNNYYEPTFLYESFFCLIIFTILIIVRNNKKIKKGQIIALYCIFYGTVRLFVESLRQDSLMLANIKVAQLVSILMIILGFVIFIKSYIRSKND